jgi:signal transduction histidine kinase/ligand-binding sensor domain-containing protein
MRYQDGEIVWLTMHDLSPSNSITALAEDGEGRLWVGTEAGLAVFQNGQTVTLKDIESFRGKPVTALFKDRQGAIWLGITGMGVFQFQNGNFIQLADASVNALLQDPHCLLVDRAGRIWVGAGDDFVLCRDNDQWHRYRLPRHSPGPYVTALAEEPDGTVWAGSVSEGLFQFKAGKLAAVNASSGLLDNLVGSLLVDREGKLWVGTDTGLNRLQHRNLFTFGQDEGVGQGAVLGLAELLPGVIWALKPNGGLYRWEGKKFGRLTAAGLSPHDTRVGALLVARDGSCWVACTNGLLHFKDPQAVADESRLLVLTNLSIISLAEDNEGRIWAGTREGELWRLGYGRWVKQTNLRQANPITAIVQDADGSMWIGTDGSGLYRFKDDVRAHFDKSNGLSSDSIRTLYLAAQNVLWIGTAGGGLARWRDNQVVNFTTREGLPDNTVSQILEDHAGRLWIGCDRGIACIGRRELDELGAGRINTIYPHIYDRADGMLSEECSSGFFPAGLKIKSGLLWFSTTRGIVMVDPHHHPTNAPAPAVMLEEVLVDGVPNTGFKGLSAGSAKSAGGKQASKALHIPPGKHRFEIQYTGLSFDAPEQMRFRYRLEGLDADWVEAGTRRTAFYNYVPPGEYRFSVIASDSDGAWTEAGTSLELVVSRHFWQKWWVITLAAVGLLISVGGSVRLAERRKLQRRLKRLEQEGALERERTRIAQDLHDEMGAKLCRISFLSEHARRSDKTPGELQHQIASISDASREVLHSLDEIVWAVNPQNDTLEHVASYVGQYTQDYFQNTGVECELDIPAQLPPHPISSQARHHLFLAVNEAFSNTLKHSRAARCRVTISCSTTAFEICVSDNGAGFDQSVIESNAASSGNGLRNMRQRLADIGGLCRVESQPGLGTTVRFVFPLDELIK